MRATHALRLALREVGRRQVDAGALEQIGDIFYLALGEVVAPALYAERVPPPRPSVSGWQS